MNNPLAEPIIGRWHNYFLEHGANVKVFFKDYFAAESRNILMILGKGFDPRMCEAVIALREAAGAGKRDIIALEFDEGVTSASQKYKPMAEDNWKVLSKTFGSMPEVRTVRMSKDGRRIASQSAAGLFRSADELFKYTDIFVDISAMPRSVFFAVISKLLFLIDKRRLAQPSRINLHVLVAENPLIDKMIRDVEVDENAGPLYPFGGSLQSQSTADYPKLWIPLIGESQQVQLERIYEAIKPDEIFPLVASSCCDPRRGDELVLEHREFLFDQHHIDPRNFIYAMENNPFDVYRQICKSVVYFNGSMKPLGGVKTFLSALSSKLLSLGCLLAAYELKSSHTVGVVHVEARGFELDDDLSTAIAKQPSDLYDLWLLGECYE